MASTLFPRHARLLVFEALQDTRVVFVMGARQVGKSTLTAIVAEHDHPARVLTLDDRGTRAAALDDPSGFVAALDSAVVIDEVQRAPDLLLAIKETVDRDALYAGAPPQVSDAPVGRAAFVDAVSGGGYPEALARRGRRRERWFGGYLDTTLDRDLRDVSDALRLDAMPRLLRLLAAQAAGLLNYKTVADRLQLHPDTIQSYTQLLETVFLVQRLPAWRPGLGPREVHSPKLHLVDTGLLAHLLTADSHRIAHDDQVTGRLVENFVAMEIVKHAGWADTDARVHHYRDGRDEIDLVLESRSGEIAAVEVKAGASLEARDWRALARLSARSARRGRRARGTHSSASYSRSSRS